MRAFYLLVNGIKKDGYNEKAINLLVDIYIRDFKSPGVEADLIAIISGVPGGVDIYERIEASLDSAEEERKLKSLQQAKESSGWNTTAPPPPQQFLQPETPNVAGHGRLSSLTPTPRRVESPVYATQPNQVFQDPYGAAPQPPHSDPYAYPPQTQQPYYPPQTQQPYYPPQTQQPQPSYPQQTPFDGSPQHAATPSPIMPQTSAPQLTPISANGESATTGMFTSIGKYIDEEHRELQIQLEKKNKQRVLLLGVLVTLVIVVLLVAVKGPQKSESPNGEQNNEPEITAPINHSP